MTRSGGKRSNTRNVFSQSFRKHGFPHSSTYLQLFKIGDLVDIKVNPSIHKGMPFKYYHGKTGKIFNITKSSVGLRVFKIVGNRKIQKKINVKIEHIKKNESKIELSKKKKTKDIIRRKKENRESKIFNFFQKNLLYNEKHTVGFQRINPVEPEPYCVVV
jgi:large subunit ribosomal protein L21e